MSDRERQRRKTAKLFRRVIRNTLSPKETLTVSEWAERYRVLDGASNIQGKWSNDVTPYLRGIMDSFVDPAVRRIYFCKASQIGGTEAMLNMLGYIVTESPAPTMIVYPTDDLGKEVSNLRIKPAFRLIPEVKKVFKEQESKELELRFTTMTLFLNGAGSPSKLASKPIKYLFFDEIDKMGGASKKEASPFNLALERTKTYRPQEKVYACSTPTLRDNYIWNLHDGADEVRHYFVPCPNCGEMIELRFAQIRFEKDDEKQMSIAERAKTATYFCEKCGMEIKNESKPEMLRRGEWQAVRKRGIGAPRSVGFWINSLYSVFLKWEDVAEEFLKSYEDPEQLQNFTNSWLGEPWEDTKLKTTADTVQDRETEEEEFVVPSWAVFLTGGVDVQETSLYYTIRAWGEYTTSQNITHGQALGFEEIADAMNREYKTADGRKMVVKLCLVDSGYQADSTYDFCVSNSDWALPVKGSSNPMRDRYKISKVDRQGSRAYGMQLVLVDGSQFKDSISARMRRENGKGSWMVFRGCDEEYRQQVTAEHKVVERSGGKEKTVWRLKHSHADNHYLDCEVYAMAAAEMCGVRSLHLATVQENEQEEKPKQPRKEDGWIQNVDGWMEGYT